MPSKIGRVRRLISGRCSKRCAWRPLPLTSNPGAISLRGRVTPSSSDNSSPVWSSSIRSGRRLPGAGVGHRALDVRTGRNSKSSRRPRPWPCRRQSPARSDGTRAVRASDARHTPRKARQIFEIPEGNEAWTAKAIGYRAEPTTLPDALKERDLKPRQRKPLSQFVFGGKWGNPSPLVLVR